MSKLVLKNVGKSYGTFEAVVDFSLELKAGEFVSLLGPSGCGKTTTLRMIAGLEVPDAGAIRILDRPVFSAGTGIDVPPAQRKVGFVFQSYALWPHMTVAKNVAFGLERRGLSRIEVNRKVEDALAIVGLSSFASRRPAQLSGGQQQRVAIARSLCMEPRVMLFDEPTSALDPEMVQEVLEVMQELASDGITMVVVTHEVRFARKVASRVVLMADGLVVEEAAPEQFFNNPQHERSRQFLSQIA